MGSRLDVLIPLSKKGKHAGKYTAIVSYEDKDLAELNWNVTSPRRNLYAIRTITINSKGVNRWMHRVIMERMLGRALVDKEVVDHINGNGLDNRRENLRLATLTQNMQNKSLESDNRSGYKGVRWHTFQNMWQARIRVNKKQFHLGYFDTVLDAHRAYCEAAKKYFGEFANFGANSPFKSDMVSTKDMRMRTETKHLTRHEWSQDEAWKMYRMICHLVEFKDKVNTPGEIKTRRKDAVIKALYSANELLHELYDNTPDIESESAS